MASYWSRVIRGLLLRCGMDRSQSPTDICMAGDRPKPFGRSEGGLSHQRQGSPSRCFPRCQTLSDSVERAAPDPASRPHTQLVISGMSSP